MKLFKIMPHIADTRLRVEASSFEELLAVALEGMNQILKRNFCRKQIAVPSIHRIYVSSPDPTALLVDFLSEILTLSHIHTTIFCKVEFTELDSNSLTANLIGAKVKGFDEDVKAVSYHEAEIKRNCRGNLETNLVFDI